MRQTRIEKRRRPVRVRRYTDDTYETPYGLRDVLDPRDPDIVRAKRLQTARQGENHRP
ncbi:hypothetical protein [Streptomyces fulvoviolaceus]|uniref:hypothetical protein n=1 Tax=Streptomyces fulvoviolaceus TaxID=285535 RepID=UPI0018FEFD5A|nr:hypothetical protein [Streptomyces fulvoviolaceus]MCT9078831.1 hypothetical protein [Streptomyces fulvoviolaceus]